MPPASLVIINANVITLDSKKPRAQAIAIHQNKIVATGTNRQIQKLADKNTKTVDATNTTIIPGLVDCHVHMISYSSSLRKLNLRNAKSVAQLQRKLLDYKRKNPGKQWILGGQWDQSKFAEKRYPTRWDLDNVSPDNPVFLTRVCGHVGVANSKALQLARVTKKRAVQGGRIDLDTRTGQPNGILREKAMELVSKAIPKPSQKEIEDTCITACKKANGEGLTCVHWILSSAEEIRALQKLYDQRRLTIRTYLGIPVEALDSLADLGLPTGFGNSMIKIGFIKILADGSLGGHTAALKEPYADEPETSGLMLYTEKELNRLVTKAHKAGLQLAIHAIGDQTVETVLEIYRKAQSKDARKDCRHRIEHCSVLKPTLIRKMRKLELIASVQPHFAESDFWIVDRVGEKRARWVYPLETLVREGLVVVSGSDSPIEPINPILGIWAAVSRQRIPEENLTVKEALETYTINAAYASFDEQSRGTIEAGKLADLTLLSDDPFKIEPGDIRKIKVNMTIVDGRVVYRRKR